ncbi:MAG TPA: hypothetical protein PKE21_14115 [Flavobacteriales bacterium]|nr:hypothetical protein [Flavobacteriales bacterium]HMR28613.1 hypothetical protein [Flavobacteriales bacterium]
MAGLGEGYGTHLPPLGDLIAKAGLSYDHVIHALKTCHGLLFPPMGLPMGPLRTWDKMHLERLITTVEQLALLNEVDIRALSGRCVDQVACYALCLERTIVRATNAGADPAVLDVVRLTAAMVVQVRSVITPPSAWLS